MYLANSKPALCQKNLCILKTGIFKIRVSFQEALYISSEFKTWSISILLDDGHL